MTPKFPKRLYACNAAIDLEEDELRESFDASADVNFFLENCDNGDLVGIYELVEVRRVKESKTLVKIK